MSLLSLTLGFIGSVYLWYGMLLPRTETVEIALGTEAKCLALYRKEKMGEKSNCK